jgi:hypothetical protein
MTAANPSIVGDDENRSLYGSCLVCREPLTCYDHDKTHGKCLDAAKFGKDAIIYCGSHLRVHKTGWCTVGVHQKIDLGVKTLEEGYEKAKRLGLKLFDEMNKEPVKFPRRSPVQMNRGDDTLRFELDSQIDGALKQYGHAAVDPIIARLREVFQGKLMVAVYRCDERGDEEFVIAMQIPGQPDFWMRTYKTGEGAANYVRVMKLSPDSRSIMLLNQFITSKYQPWG